MLSWIAGAILVLAIVGTPLVWLYQIIRDLLKYFLSDWYNRNLFFITLEPARKTFLEKNFNYYKALCPRDQQMFGRRVQKFINMKHFEGRNDLVITIEMETLVAAAAIQITFGFPSVYLEHFDRIILYPDEYYSTINDAYHQGEVNSKGIIVLSWKNLLQGYMQQTDGRNLALHEMAHALKISDVKRPPGYDFFDPKAVYKFISYAREEMNLIANGESSLFREYAATNDHEFFAVAIENFFERPAEFRDFHREMYESLAALMKQDPLQLNAHNVPLSRG